MECHIELVETLGNNDLQYRTVARWIGKFQQGRMSTSDEQRLGQPVSESSLFAFKSFSPSIPSSSFRDSKIPDRKYQTKHSF
ncbi:hypothetical protein TNCV_1006541 [Trichonephila clavipes]|nr:hypothetical protein TNCV_1006541 [Trichonephila clavipes]